MLLTPKDEKFPFPMPVSQVHISLVIIPNFICILVHLLAAVPKGPDYHRGYQHGGVLVDFIGQRPPAYRIYYILVDIMILAVQGLMLAVHSQRERLRVTLKTFPAASTDAAQQLVAEQTPESLDAEERGVRRNQEADETYDIEMQPLRNNNEDEDGEDNEDAATDASRQRKQGNAASPNYLSDVMASGNAILGDYNILRTIRTAAWSLERSAATSFQSIGYGATIAALQARQRTSAARRQSNTT